MKTVASIAALGLLLAGAAAAQTPDTKTLVIAMSADSDSWDPDQITSRDASNVEKMMFGTLYEVSSDGKLKPNFADSYSLAKDGTEITFKLHPGLKCGDGSPLTATDVAYTFERAADKSNKWTGSNPGFVLPAIGYKGVRVDDDLTATLLVEKYNPIAIGLISEVYVFCKAAYSAMSLTDAASKPSPTGPYRLVQWLRDDRAVFERNPTYTLPPPAFERVVRRVIPEASTRAAELIAGTVDVITNVAPDQVDAVNASGRAKVKPVAGTRRMYVGFNQKDKFANIPGGQAIRKPEVRQALQYAVDVQSICESLLRYTCERASSPVNKPNDDPSLKAYPFDPKKAEQLLDEAGYKRGPDGTRFEITLQAPRGRYINDANVALAIGQMLTDVGVKTKVDILDWSSVYVGLTRTHDAGPLFFLGTGGATWSALYDLSDWSTPTAGTNYAEWKDPEFFDGWKRLDQTRDPAQMQLIVNDMLRVFHDRGPWLLLYFQPDYYGVANRVDWEPRRDEQVNAIEMRPKS